MIYPTLAHFRHFSHFSSLLTNFRSTTVENSLQITPFYAKQSQFYAFFARKRRFHEKTNPIQTQLKPIQTQFNPIQSQFKANFKLPQTLQRIEKKYLSYGEQAEARRLFARIPAGVRNKLLDTDYSAAEAHCPQHMPIAKLVAEAVSKLPD